MTESSQRRSIPDPIMQVLRCPLCSQPLAQEPARLHCAHGHSFDRAKQGYVTLRRGGPTPKNADTPAMVAARESLLGSGLYAPIREQLGTHVAQHFSTEHDDAGTALATDLGGGTGYYLAGILDKLPGAYGVCIDLSAAALKRAARCHGRAAAIGNNLLADPLPLADQSVDVATSIFGPRNVPEIQRTLRDDGFLVVVSPTSDHLAELVKPLGMIQVDERKEERLSASLAAFGRIVSEPINYTTPLNRQQARALVEMGPSAHHITPEELSAGLHQLPEDLTVTVSVTVGIYTLIR